MCTMLAGGLAGYGIGQANKKAEEAKGNNVTNNYYGGKESTESTETATTNKDSLKTQRPKGPSQSSKTNQAY